MNNKELLQSINVYIDRIMNYVNNVSYTDFIANQMIIDAVVLNMEQIGEAANKLSLDFRKSNDNIDWDEMIGLRHKAVHHYDGIDPTIIWDIAAQDVIKLKKDISNLLDK